MPYLVQRTNSRAVARATRKTPSTVVTALWVRVQRIGGEKPSIAKKCSPRSSAARCNSWRHDTRLSVAASPLSSAGSQPISPPRAPAESRDFPASEHFSNIPSADRACRAESRGACWTSPAKGDKTRRTRSRGHLLWASINCKARKELCAFRFVSKADALAHGCSRIHYFCELPADLWSRP